jgi:hypothetical protein
MKNTSMVARVVLPVLCLVVSGCITWNSGLEPVSPSYGYLWNAHVDSLNPKLAWKPYDKPGAQDIRYHLEVIDDGVIVLSQGDIRETSFQVDRKLEAGKKYEWRVRPIWASGGYVNLGPWNYKKYFIVTPAIILFVGFGGYNYNFSTPEK